MLERALEINILCIACRVINLFGFLKTGKLLEALKRLMGNLTSLQNLELRDLLLDTTEGQTLLDEVCATCSLTLQELILVNATEAPCQLLHVGIFLNLQVCLLL